MVGKVRGGPSSIKFSPNPSRHFVLLQTINEIRVETLIEDSDVESIGLGAEGLMPGDKTFCGKVQNVENQRADCMRRDSRGDSRDDDGDRIKLTRVVEHDCLIQH